MNQILRVCEEMCNARKYKIIQTDPTNHAIVAMQDYKYIYIEIIQHKKLNVEIIKYFYSFLHRNNIHHAILIYHNSVTSSVKKLLSTLDIYIELFLAERMRYNILKHRLVPEHNKVGEETDDTKHFPTIEYTDPVVRFLGFKKGDVLAIKRTDASTYLRVVR